MGAERKVEYCEAIEIGKNSVRVVKVNKNDVEELMKVDQKFRELCHQFDVDPKKEHFPPSDKMKAVLKALQEER